MHPRGVITCDFLETYISGKRDVEAAAHFCIIILSFCVVLKIYIFRCETELPEYVSASMFLFVVTHTHQKKINSYIF